jgi:hypothetical protein
VPQGKFRESFWPTSRKKNWSRLAQELDDCTINFQRLGLSFHVTQIVGDWPLQLTQQSDGQTITTVLHAPFLNPNKTKISMRRTGLLGFLYKNLKEPAYRSGHKKLDKAFTMHSSERELIGNYLADDHVRNLLIRQPMLFHMSIRNDLGLFGESYGENVDALHLSIPKIISNIDHLKSLFELAKAWLIKVEAARRFVAGQPDGATPDPKALKPLVQYHQEELDPVLAFFGSQLERQDGKLKARFGHPDEILTGEASLEMGIPTLPAYASDIVFTGPHLPLSRPLTIKSKKSVLDHLGRTDRPRNIRAGFAISHQSEHEAYLQSCEAELIKMLPFDCQIEITETALNAKISEVSGFRLKECVYLLLEFWRKSSRYVGGL